ncbi:fumarylacetoacetate hydrolase [Streptacidiphilus neutrinimicus]|uniref:fumarylacetoacetate hydrolase n=1 Tax=Streptacidiphilus neutrinimicus TaxID=105420 RepID=UPI0005A773B6|nr:fumarylacetoacetate hydrolase [Streptacidiphilus neutrinimicus]
MTAVFECTYDNERYVGLGLPQPDGALRLYPLGDLRLAELLPRALADGTDVAAVVARAGHPVEVPAADRRSVRTRPPLLTGHPGDTLVGGFMMTHNVKVDAQVPDQPNWFVKGLGDALRLPGEPLGVPADAVAVCEEAEVVLVYVGDADGVPRYAGYTFGNDLTDIGRFKQHAGHLSYAKLCDAAVAPWLFAEAPPRVVTGRTTVERDGQTLWQGEFTTGAQALYYDLDAITARLLAYRTLHRPGRVHYVYLGADRGSFHAGVGLRDGDRIVLDFASHGVVLDNRLAWSGPSPYEAEAPQPRPVAAGTR